MPFETEIKVRLGSLKELTKVLSNCYALFGGESIPSNQLDEYFDTDEEDLKNQDYTVRLRTINNHAKIALKSPRVFLDGYVSNRIELELSVKSAEEARQELSRLGLRVTAAVEKKRWHFRSSTCEVVIDELPFVGSFMEVEAPSVDEIDLVLQNLGVSRSDAVKDNYSEIIEAKFREIGLPLRPNLNATFAAEAEFVRGSNS